MKRGSVGKANQSQAMALIIKAADFAAFKHRDQRRKDIAASCESSTRLTRCGRNAEGVKANPETHHEDTKNTK